MGNTSEPTWVNHIQELLEQARTKDVNMDVFGAGTHQYKLEKPVSEMKIRAFEQQYGIDLPEEYRNFLMLVGNGGAGPYYGIYGLRALKEQLQKERGYLSKADPVIYPGMSDEEWDSTADPEGRGESEELFPYGGILPIGSQGCTLMTGLVLKGPYCGQVVYYDEDLCGKPFFVREKGFLAWYERWLREVILGYNDEGVGFGICLDGNPQQLAELYGQAKCSEKKAEIIASFYKFQELPEEQKIYLKQACAQEADMKIRVKLIILLGHFQVEEIVEEIDKLWEYGAYGEAISAIACTGGRETKEKWCERIIEKLPQMHGDGFADACYIIKAMKDYPNVHAGILKEVLLQKDLDRNDRIALFYCIGDLKKKEEVLDYFLEYLSKEQDCHQLIYGIQAMGGVTDSRLQTVYVKLLDKYRTNANVRIDYEGSQTIYNGSCLGASRPEGQVVSNLLRSLEWFCLDYSGAWKLLMDDLSWKEWKEKRGFC